MYCSVNLRFKKFEFLCSENRFVHTHKHPNADLHIAKHSQNNQKIIYLCWNFCFYNFLLYFLLFLFHFYDPKKIYVFRRYKKIEIKIFHFFFVKPFEKMFLNVQFLNSFLKRGFYLHAKLKLFGDIFCSNNFWKKLLILLKFQNILDKLTKFHTIKKKFKTLYQIKTPFLRRISSKNSGQQSKAHEILQKVQFILRTLSKTQDSTMALFRRTKSRYSSKSPSYSLNILKNSEKAFKI